MGRVLTIEQSTGIVKQLKRQGKKIVLVGGCFDVLHAGHVMFLAKAKSLGDTLVVMLESDEKVRELKGPTRPINSQTDRATILSSLSAVDYVIVLPHLRKDKDYEILVKQLEPDIIAVTKGDKALKLKRKYAEMVGGKVIEAVPRYRDYSTTRIAQKVKL